MSLTSNNLIMKPPPLPPKKVIRNPGHLNLSSNVPASPTLSSPDRSFNSITAFEHYDPHSPKAEAKKHIHICKKHRVQNRESEILVIEDIVNSNESNCLEQKSIPVMNPKMCKRLAKIKPMMKNEQSDLSDFMNEQDVRGEKFILDNEHYHSDLKNRLISEIKQINSGDTNKDVIYSDKRSLDQSESFQNKSDLTEGKHLSKLTFSSNSDMSSSFCQMETQPPQCKAVRRNSFNGIQNEQPVSEKSKRKNSFNEFKNALKFGTSGGGSDRKKSKEKKCKSDKGKEKCDKVSKDIVDSICKASETIERKISFDSSPKIEFTFDMHVTSDIKNKITKKERKSELYEILKSKNNEMNEIISKENDIIASIKAKEQLVADQKRNLANTCNSYSDNIEHNCDKSELSTSRDKVITTYESSTETHGKSSESPQTGKGNVSPTKTVNFVNFVDTIDDRSPKFSKANRNLRLKINNDIKPVSILKKNDGECGSKSSTPEVPIPTVSSPLSIPPSPPLKPFERKSSFRSNTNDLQEIKQKIDDSFQKQNLILQHHQARLQNLQALTAYSSLRKQKTASRTNLTRSHSDSNLSVASSYRNSLDLDEIFTIEDSDGMREDGQNGYFSKYFKALSGSWKNLFTLGGMNRQNSKTAPVIKKVAPPTVPDFRHSGSSFGSAGYSSSGEDTFSITPAPVDAISKDTSGVSSFDVTDSCYPTMAGKSPGAQFNYPAFTFPGPPSQYTQLVHGGAKSNTYYHHQLSLQEDQGIDMTQSPGRDSPGSSGSGSRHSTASLDSGRASSCHLSSGHTRSSVSSSSVSSAEQHAASTGKVERLLQQGVPDQDILHSWLMDIRFEEYFPLFVAAGYDMHTISRMTPEDLTAIGIKKPNHRKKLKSEIAQLSISDGLPEFIPGSLEEWLHLLRLNEYGPALGCQGYTCIDDVTQLTWEDLEDIGIVRLGHQKKILLAIKRVKDLRAGKIFPPPSSSSAPGFSPNTIQTQVSIESPSPSSGATDCDCPPLHTAYHSFHQPWEIESSRNMYFATDLVPIKIRGARGKSLESLEESMSSGVGGTSSFTSPDFPSPVRGEGGWRRSYDDADITPTNESMPLHGGGVGGGTLPRPRGLVRPRLVAKVPAQSFYRNEDLSCSGGTLKRFPPPSPPKRTDCSPLSHAPCTGVTSVELHSTAPPPPPAPQSHHERHLNHCADGMRGTLNHNSKLGDSQEGISGSSTESDSLPFANENAGTIKQRSGRNVSDYAASNSASNTVQSSPNESTSSSHSTSNRKEPADVLNDIGNMLANLTDELDAMLEEEKRQGLNDD